MNGQRAVYESMYSLSEDSDPGYLNPPFFPNTLHVRTLTPYNDPTIVSTDFKQGW